MGDNWANLSTYVCASCRFFVPKDDVGRCRRNAPTMDGFPVVYPSDWCGNHKLGTNPSREKMTLAAQTTKILGMGTTNG